MPASPSDRPPRPRPSRRFHRDERAVSEVVGQILSLGITSTLLIATLYGFALAKDNATERAVIVRGDALLQRISATAVQAALFAEEHPGSGVEYNGRVELPQELEGHPYQIDLDPDEVFLIFPRFDRNVSAPLFQAGAGVNVVVCDIDPIPGGPVRLVLRPVDDTAVPSVCHDASPPSPVPLALFLETDS